MIRIGLEQKIETFFDMIRVATIAEEEVDILYQLFYKSLKQLRRYFYNNQSSVYSVEYRQLRIIPEFLSSICFACQLQITSNSISISSYRNLRGTNISGKSSSI